MRSSNLYLYHYKGPIFVFQQYMQDYEAETWAVSAAEAASNIKYQFKKDIGYNVNLRVDIDRAKLELVKDPIRNDFIRRPNEVKHPKDFDPDQIVMDL